MYLRNPAPANRTRMRDYLFLGARLFVSIGSYAALLQPFTESRCIEGKLNGLFYWHAMSGSKDK